MTFAAFICEGLCSLPKYHHILYEPLDNLCIEVMAKINIFYFTGGIKKKILKFKCVDEDLSMIRDGTRMVSWSSGATFLPLYLGRDGGGECVLFKKKN